MSHTDPYYSSPPIGYAPVAQLDRALASGAKGRRFESFRACHPEYKLKAQKVVVAIAQLVEPWIVIPVVASSNLVSHPINFGSFLKLPV